MSRLAERQFTYDEAVALCGSWWWESCTAVEIAVFQLSQKRLCVASFSIFARAMEEALGRGVFTHEFADPDALWSELIGRVPMPTTEEAVDKLVQLVGADKVFVVRTDQPISEKSTLDKRESK